MSHIGNKLLSGFYATPEQQGVYLSSLISFVGETAVFDPTCGEGKILKQLAEASDFPIKTYGVELDKRRAATASTVLDRVIQAPIESMVISHNVYGMVFLNPPYDHTMIGIGDDEGSDRKEYTELVRNTKYLVPGGLMVYIIPSYRFADTRISRFLATHFEDIGIAKFSDEDYEDFKQCIFIGRKKSSQHKKVNTSLLEFLQQLDNESFVQSKVTPINIFIGHKKWEVPETHLEIPTFYSKIENKNDFIDMIRANKGFQAFKERTKPKQLVIGGEPIINIAQGQMALLLASGAVNGIIGEGDTLHAVQGMEIVTNVTTEEKTEHTIITKTRTKREVSVKVILPLGKVRKLV
ncbi:DUF6094 domain-containing protein [Bacillus cihuensis]|uniref:DUF6094 domain-containing protein n=1 Tax=Bacillus cihuensis TaxID=1208599 RepID=UPI0003F7CC80|nr:DUF6094 domain-containing protein [Bacillus cihuensis]